MEEKHFVWFKRNYETGKLIEEKVEADRDLQERQQTFIEPENWPPNSPDLNPVDYSVCLGEALPQMVYSHTISDNDQLKRVLIDCWAQLSQDTLNRAIDQLPKRLMMVIKQRVPMLNFI